MTDLEIWTEINNYAEKVLGDINPEKTQVSFQLNKLKPAMQEVAAKTGLPIEDVFIKYMDIASTQRVNMDKKFKETMENAGVTDLNSLPF